MRGNIIFFLTVITVLAISTPVFAVLSGAGTESNPYLIQSRADFDEFIGNSNYWNSGFFIKLMCDLDLGDITYSQAPIASSSLGSFYGVFDGDFHVISNLTIIAPTQDKVGLFGNVGASEIKNLGLENVNISGHINVGSLIGRHIKSTITSCYATGSVTGENAVGGLVGSYDGGKTISCYTTGSVTGNDNVGGLVGWGEYISCCYSESSVIGNSNWAGGLVGYGGSISDGYATGSVSGHTNVGGLVGEGYSITNSYATGSVDGESRVGGLAGYGESINYCFAAGLVNGSTEEVGGLVGIGQYMDVCYWDTETSGQTIGVGVPMASAYVFGKTTAEMKTISTYTVDGDHYPGWRISDMDGFDADWIMVTDGQDYPQISYFAYRGPSGTVPLLGDGTQANPCQVGSAADLVNLSQYGLVWKMHIILTADIDMAGAFMRPIGNSVIRFSGTFDGQNHIIQNLGINLPEKDYVGLFGCLGEGGQITNLNLESINLAGRRYVGGVVGSNFKGAVSNCNTTGTVTGGSCSYAGGVVGGNIGGTVSNCSSSVTVSGMEATLGGLVGCSLAGGALSDCSVTGDVSDNDPNAHGSSVGGLVGSNLETTITNCSAAGDVSTTASAYMNIGGLIGENLYGTTVSNSFAAGNVDVNSISSKATICGGGLIGQNTTGELNNCYAAGSVIFNCDVESYYYFGGLTGLNTEGTVNRCYSSGLVDLSGTPEADVCTAGSTGLNIDGLFNESYWDAQSSGTNDGVGGEDPDPNTITGKTTAEMMTQSTFAGWDFSQTGDWKMLREGEDYPRLAWQQMITGDVTGLYGVDVVDLGMLSECWLETVQIDSDIHTDGIVNLSDFSLLAQQWMTFGCGLCNGADITGDGNVDDADLMYMTEQWLQQVNTSCQIVDFDTSGKIGLGDMAIFAGHWLEGI